MFHTHRHLNTSRYHSFVRDFSVFGSNLCVGYHTTMINHLYREHRKQNQSFSFDEKHTIFHTAGLFLFLNTLLLIYQRSFTIFHNEHFIHTYDDGIRLFCSSFWTMKLERIKRTHTKNNMFLRFSLVFFF